jgi:hypothetical protein
MAVRQEPVVQWSRVGPHRQEQEEGGSHNHSHSSSSQQSGPEPGPSGSNSDKTASSHAQGAGAQQGRTTGGGGTCDSVIIHPPDMQLPVAWQLAYRGIMRHVAEAAAHQAKSESGATEAKEFHVVLRFHTRSAQLLYLPVRALQSSAAPPVHSVQRSCSRLTGVRIGNLRCMWPTMNMGNATSMALPQSLCLQCIMRLWAVPERVGQFC